MLSATLFSFLSSDNSALSCMAVDCLMALVDLIGLMSEKEVSFISVEVSLFKASQNQQTQFLVIFLLTGGVTSSASHLHCSCQQGAFFKVYHLPLIFNV